MKSALLKYYPLLALLLLCGFYLFKAIDFPANDFANYYFGGKFLAKGNFSSNIYFPYEFNKAIFDSGYPNIFVSYAPNTPFLAFSFLLFAGFSLAVAKIIFNSLSVVLFFFSIYRLFNHYKIDWRYALLIPVLFLVPIKNNLLFGQVYFLLFFLLSEGWLAYEKKQWKSMSLFWSLAILLKVFPVLLVALFIFRKQWKPLSFWVAFCLLLLGISILFTGVDIWIFYLQEVLPKASNGEIATGFVDNYQSVFMFLKRCFVFETIENPNAFYNYPNLFSALMVAFKIGVLVIGYFISKRNSNTLFVFSYWILAMILLSPYGSTYTFILLLFPFLALLKSEISNTKKVAFCLIIFLINNFSLSIFIGQEFPFSYLRMLLLFLFFVLFLLQFRQKVNWKAVAMLSLFPLFLILFFKTTKPEKSTILLENGPTLVYDYEINNNSLIGHFWDGREKVILWNTKIQTFHPLKLKNNQVFYNNQQLTFDKSHKRKPILIDNKTVLYLSDYDRGIGFYTLRKITLN
ncbi:glycosyltransferase family 87 protein [Flavobacterium sp. UBA7682]|uniref:glycosyltransferase family 87 protein n=1 Tax=Flavobacterium sp. UBA7682 TaxID=1946560 RepID=UPI0025BDAB3B|nr:glycosyltransferase family 87 protein [Flavobacterium sp. UBA7682]